MTPYEFYLYCEGVTDKLEDHFEMIARFHAAQMTMWCDKGKSVKASQLFKRRDAPPEFSSPEEQNVYMRERIGDDE